MYASFARRHGPRKHENTKKTGDFRALELSWLLRSGLSRLQLEHLHTPWLNELSKARRREVKPEAPREAFERYRLTDVNAAGTGTVGGDA